MRCGCVSLELLATQPPRILVVLPCFVHVRQGTLSTLKVMLTFRLVPTKVQPCFELNADTNMQVWADIFIMSAIVA